VVRTKELHAELALQVDDVFAHGQAATGIAASPRWFSTAASRRRGELRLSRRSEQNVHRPGARARRAALGAHHAPRGGDENGQTYYERCLAILADLEEADLASRGAGRAARHPAGQRPDVVGTLHLAAPSRLMEQYPELRSRWC